MNKKGADIKVSDHGSIWLFDLRTVRARNWVKKHVVVEEPSFLGSALVVGQHYVQELASGMQADGLLLSWS